MRLKKVQIFGFKTFAEKTEFDIDAEMIAVVGPNGCGKSNIVDSILWGLGETKASHIRAKTGQDVIFAGSGRRRKLGFAEVTLIFDNEDGTLPIDTPEVSVTRRLTRNGDSKYRINGRNCRLRDVNDLLADSGMGRAGYAIVGQSEIDQALAASPERRRDWIDEAAGVQRYRARRVESLRRLAAADEHLERVNDIIKEIESQRKPLEKEAETARQYKQVRTSLREMESGLLINEIGDAVAKLDELDERLKNAVKIAEKESIRAEVLEKEASEVTDELAVVEESIDALRQAHHEAQTAFEQASASLQVAQSKLESLDVLETTITNEAETGHELVAQAEKDLGQAKIEEEAEANALQALRTELSGADDEARKLTHGLRLSEAELMKAREIAAKRQRAEMESAHRQERVKNINEEMQGIIDAIPDLQTAIDEAVEKFSELDKVVLEARATSQATEQKLLRMRKDEEQHASVVRRMLNEVAVFDGRRKGIQATLDAHEGLAQGARAVLESVAEGTLKGKYVPVGEAIDVEPEFALAIETALGSATNDLIVKDEGHAKRAIGHLKENRLGRATFQPIPLMRESSVSKELKAVIKSDGVIGLASELVECADEHRPVIDSLLGRVVITADLDTSLRLAKTVGWRRLVTKEGEVLHASGGVTGGRSADHTSGIVQRKAELGELIEKVGKLQKKIDKAEAEHTTREEIREVQSQKLEEARAQLEQFASEHEEAHSWQVNLQHEFQATERASEKLKNEKAQIIGIKDDEVEFIDEKAAEEKRDSCLKLLAAKSADADKAGQLLHESESRAMQASHRSIEAERRYKSLTESEESRSRRSQTLGPDRERYTLQITEAGKLKVEKEKTVNDAQEELDKATSCKKDLITKNIELAQSAKEAQKIAKSMSDTAHSAEIQRTRTDSKRVNSVQRLLEEYGMGQDEAVKLAPDTEVPEDAANLVPDLRRQMKSMGDVNLGAIEAFERLTERFDELTHQTEDINAGKNEILESISELDRLTSQRFVETFTQVQAAFGEMFAKLFGGGEGTIELMDQKNVLDSGVEIKVTVPGKKRQRLELLSGGERALSATAFLFALLKVKPSPLVILDEVDAPLDGRNVERFCGVVREFSSNSQFIIITHNAVTMEEADAWFGVTMQEPGVSTLVPVRMPKKGMVIHQTAADTPEKEPAALEPTGAYAKS